MAQTLTSLAHTATASSLPDNPTAATQTVGTTTSTVWQKDVSDPAFTWDSPSPGNVLGYYVYWGTTADGTSSTTVTSAAYDPTGVSSGTYYLRLRTVFTWATKPTWTTVYIFRYDGTDPSEPVNATVTPDVDSGTWQNSVSDVSFTWDDSTDAHSGMAGYEVYFDLEPTDTPTAMETPTAAEYDPDGVTESGKYILYVRSVDNVDNKSDWANLFELWYDGDDPTDPSDLATSDTGDTPTFTWTASTDADSGLDAYEIYWAVDTGSCGTNNQSDVTAASFTAPTITDIVETTYRICVWARDNAGNVSGSAQTTYTYTPPP